MTRSRFPLLLGLLLIGLLIHAPVMAQVTPPMPLMPIPTSRQLAWQERELIMFVHFGVNTFTDREWGDGNEDPAIFNPTRLDARQWARVARETGFKTIILTAKHHDGFNLWPSAYTAHSVKNSPWKEGKGDVVRELAEACRAEGIGLGLYLSPWDRHEPSYGDNVRYNQYYAAQLHELLTRYGPLDEIWFDGAKGEDAKDMAYDFDAYWALVRQLQPNAVMFSDAGPDVRWIGNERGHAGETCWSMMNGDQVTIGAADTGYLNAGDPNGKDWIPGECDVSIRRGWFYHEDQQPKSRDELLDIYYKSVGRNCVLLLNVPPNKEGRFSDADVERLREFREALDTIFGTDYALGGTLTAENVRGGSPAFGPENVIDSDPKTYWATDDEVISSAFEIELAQPATFNVIRIEEPIAMGQRVEAFRVQVRKDGAWETVSTGTTIGYRRLLKIEPVQTDRVRVIIEKSRACPLISGFGLHFDPFLP